MSSFKEKERFKEQQEQFQAVLSALLKDEDNKYCVDCDAKGPRWASWNIGIFLCIRCAGIHRNLGVHISKVKSVNLDTWTPEQVAMMQEMGNSRGRAVYEANIPDGFRRPQTDSALEAFIRSKYEQKKYIAREWIPPQPKVPKEWLDDPKGEKKKAKAKPAVTSVQLTNVTKLVSKSGETSPQGDFNKPVQGPKPEVKVAVRTETLPNSASNDLLGLEAAAPPPSYGNNELLDLFGGPQISQSAGNTAPTQSNSDLMNGASEGGLFGDDKSTGGGGTAKTSAKDSIMALYGGSGSTNQPQMYGVPGSGVQSYIFQAHASHSDLTITNPTSAHASQSQPLMQTSLNHQTAIFSTSTTQQPLFNNLSPSVPALASQQPSFGQITSGFGVASNQNACNSSVQSGLYLPFNQSSVHGIHQQSPPVSSNRQTPTVSGQFLSATKQMPGFSNNASPIMGPQDYSQSMGSNPAWGGYNPAQSAFYGNQGGVYMPQGQQMYQGIMGQQQGMMGIQGIRQQGMMGQPQGMMGQPQGMGIMGQPHGMMGNPAMNTPQMAMYNTPMMAGNPGMYTPQQMQQLQYQQMQQQMTSLKLGGSQMGSVPQQTTGTAGWGSPSQGQTLSTNLWQ